MFPTLKSFKSVVALFCLVIVSLIPLFVEPDVSLSQFSSPVPQPKNPIVTFYAEAMKIDYDEAEHRLALQAEMSIIKPNLMKDEAYFAAWIHHEPDFGLVVSFTTADGEERIRKYLTGMEWADLVSVEQSDITRDELLSMRDKVVTEAAKTDIPFAAGLNYQAGKVRLYLEQVDELRLYLEGNAQTAPIIDKIELIKEAGVKPLDYDYPYLLGGHATGGCTTGFAVYRTTVNLRYMSTAGHCFNTDFVKYNGSNAVYMGNMVWENDPIANVGQFGDDLDFQVHDAAGARSFDLTNRIKTGTTTTVAVIGTQSLADTYVGDIVCKYGKTTGFTCGEVDDLFCPGDDYGTSCAYVRVDRLGSSGNMACPGDSGSPVFKYVSGGVDAVGVLSGGGGSSNPASCSGNTFYIYSPIDYINVSPYRILTTDYPLYFHQNVFTSGSSCTSYKRPLDASGNPAGAQTSMSCQTEVPAGSSGEVRTYTAYVIGNYLREAMWRGTKGYIRDVPLNADGTANWGAVSGNDWHHCCTLSSPPAAQGAYIIGNFFQQNVWQEDGSCTEYSKLLNNNGVPYGSNIISSCGTSLPAGSSGTVETYTAWVVGEHLHEAMWRGGKGYIRAVPLNDFNTDIDWSRAPGWHQCCTGTGPKGQGGYILTHP